jgi:sodium-independent sulfate anion transporter 11
LSAIQIYSSGIDAPRLPPAERLWNASSNNDKTIEKTRSQAGFTAKPSKLRVVILDVESVAWIETIGSQALVDAKKDIKAFAGDGVVLRFVGVNKGVRTKFELSGWKLVDAGDVLDEVHLGEG